MKYFSEDEEYINSECEKCGRVLKIPRTSCVSVPAGYETNSPYKCPCGQESKNIRKNNSNNPLLNQESRKKPNTYGNNKETWMGITILLLILGSGVYALTNWDSSSTDSNSSNYSSSDYSSSDFNSLNSSSSDYSSLSSSTTVSDDDKGILWECALDAVKQSLKAPSTAKFPFSYYDATFNSLGNDMYEVKSWVDAQNSYGAMLRSNFTVSIKKISEGTFQAQDVKIE